MVVFEEALRLQFIAALDLFIQYTVKIIFTTYSSNLSTSINHKNVRCTFQGFQILEHLDIIENICGYTCDEKNVLDVEALHELEVNTIGGVVSRVNKQHFAMLFLSRLWAGVQKIHHKYVVELRHLFQHPIGPDVDSFISFLHHVFDSIRIQHDSFVDVVAFKVSLCRVVELITKSIP